MNHEEKITYLLKWAAANKVSKWRVAPPIFRMAWKCGLKIPPPHFMPFLPLAFIGTLGWGIPMTAVVWFSSPLLSGHSSGCIPFGNIQRFSVTMLTVSAAFGFSVAAIFRYEAHKYKLGKWEDFPS
jgi:hypothetical protein